MPQSQNLPQSGIDPSTEEPDHAGRRDEVMEDRGDEIAQLKSKLRELEIKNEELQKTAMQISHEKDDLGRKLTVVNQEKDDLGRKLNGSLVKIRKLNELIVKNSQQSDEPPDTEVLEETYKIRNLVTSIVRTHFAGDTKFIRDKAEQLESYYRSFYFRRLKDLPAEGRKRLLISMIFGELQLHFFGTTVKRFGLDRETEAHMQSFERQIETSNKGTRELLR